MTDDRKRALWAQAASEAATVADGCADAMLPWRYRQKVEDFLKPQSRILDMAPGDGAFLLALRHPFAQTSVAESRPAALQRCEKKLAPLGIAVRQSAGDGTLPYDDDSFDLVLDRGALYAAGEVRRVLKHGGYFITEQAGGSDSLRLRRMLGGGAERLDFNLENEIPRFLRAGFSINYKDQCYAAARFSDTAALVRYAAARPQLFPGFSVDGCFAQLLTLDALCARQGYIPDTRHRFILIARKRKDGKNDG
ncbi:MAG TPA: class I SAM-dependent methyltransferase [Candidatus Ruminococcus gallistercoris]|nr:class I SAM-dependent methyltransferase [Candidatus Ruminococcus gallistercoris]